MFVRPLVRPVMGPLVRRVTAARRGRASLSAQVAALLASFAGPKIWYDPSDINTMFQDAAGTTPVAAVEQPAGLVRDKSGGSNHAPQATTTSRPVLSARVNLLVSTDAITALWGPWTGGTRTVANDGPFGWAATTLTGPPSSTALLISQQFPSPSAVLAYRVYAKANGDNTLKSFLLRNNTTATNYQIGTWNPATGAITGAGWTSVAVGDGWYQLDFTQTGVPIGNLIAAYLGFSGTNVDASTSLKLSSPQVVAGTTSGRYQRVTSASDYDTVDFPRYLRFDGVDDSLATAAIDFTSTDKVTVIAGLRKLSDAGAAVTAELGADANANAGSFFLAAPPAASATWGVAARGATTTVTANQAAVPSPAAGVLTGQMDLSAPLTSLRVNGALALANPGATGGGAFGTYPLFIGRRNNSILPFNGNLYGLIVIGRLLTAPELAVCEQYMAQQSGVTL